jgi:D-glucosaminate-6-phosphate ammonia-lyase
MNVYERLGVPTIINGCGTVTRLGGAPMPKAVTDAFVAGADHWVSLEQMQAAASRKISELTKTEAALVTSGSAAALTLGTAAILTGHELGRMEQLPNTEGMPNEFIVAREQRSGYDHAVRAAGANLIEVGFNEVVSNAGVRRTELWEYEAAVNARTAGILYVSAGNSVPSLEDVASMAQRHSLPVLVDAAGELPPRSNLQAIAARGADLVAFSGGKAIRGPQSTGILCGKRRWISAAALQMLDMDDHFELWEPPPELIDRSKISGHPRHGIGRALKVSKEEILALLTALELFASGAYAAELPAQRARLESIVSTVSDLPLECQIVESADGERWPTLNIVVPARDPKLAFNFCRQLRQGSPPIYLGHGKLDEGVLVVNPLCLSDDDAREIGARLMAICNIC